MASLVLTVKAAGWVYTLLGGTSRVPFTCSSIAKPLVGAATTYFVVQHAAHRDGHRPVDPPGDPRGCGTRTSCGVRRAISSARCAAAIARQRHRPRRLLDGVAGGRAALPDLPHVQGVHGAHSGSAAPRRAGIGSAPGDDRSARAGDRRQGSDRAEPHPPRAGVRRRPRRALGMPDNEIQGVKTAALLHDIGKLAVPEHILSKPGPLTQEEFQKIRIHPQVGAEIISGVPFPYPVAPLILSHHERWDGKGYPDRAERRGDSARRTHPLGRRLFRRADVRAAVPQGDELRCRDRAAAAGKRQGARSARRADVRRDVPDAGGRSRSEPSRRAS